MCSVLCFKPFKIPFSVSCGLYRDNERNKKTDLSCCKIQPGEIPWFRCPLQTAPVRTDGFFLPETVVILHREPTRLRKTQRRIFETLVRDSPARIFVVARQQRAVPSYAENFFGIRKVPALRGRAFSQVERLFNRYYEYRPKTHTTISNSEL